MSNKIPLDKGDEYDIYDDDTYHSVLINEYVESNIYDDSPPPIHYIKKLHYEKEMNETKDYYYLCTYANCINQPVLYEHKEYHNKFYHPSLIDKILYWVCCRF